MVGSRLIRRLLLWPTILLALAACTEDPSLPATEEAVAETEAPSPEAEPIESPEVEEEDPEPEEPLTIPPPTENCTPGYSPCLPPASDYDCAGGSGDGPAYTGRVTVTGSDPYGLDADGDGVGCE